MANQPTERKITELPKDCGYLLREAIPAVVSKKGNLYTAITKDIGLLVGGSGTTPEEACDDLREVILDQFEHYQTNKELYVGFAKLVGQRLERYIVRER